MTLQRPVRASVQVSAGAQNTWTDPLLVEPGARVSVSVSGTFTATVSLQRRLDGANWRTVAPAEDPITAPTELSYVADEGCELRIGIATGDYGDGAAVCRLGKG